MKLPASERAKLAGQLFDSLDELRDDRDPEITRNCAAVDPTIAQPFDLPTQMRGSSAPSAGALGWQSFAQPAPTSQNSCQNTQLTLAADPHSLPPAR